MPSQQANKAVRVKVKGLFNSFKPRQDIRYHRTMEIPPRTTILGLAGAALGLSTEEIYVRWKNNDCLDSLVDAGVIQNGYGGKVTDYWTIVKFAGSKRPFPAIQVREQLFKAGYYIYLRPRESSMISLIETAFNDPNYPLSLGRDDELIRVEEATVVDLEKAHSPFTISNSMIPINVVESLDKESRARLLSSFAIYDLPRSFTIKKRGERWETDRRKYVYLSYPARVDSDNVEAYRDSTSDRCFVFL
ncbi:MAG: CRISPR-associated protein Cas5 [Thaumarchaeota archaeon]|nr:CRISPR-associated protein Cas5 [Nitrososphaerota archaeon]